MKTQSIFTVYWDLVQRPSSTKQFTVHTLLSDNVAVLRVFPNISAAVVRAFLQEPIEGLYFRLVYVVLTLIFKIEIMKAKSLL